MAYRNQPTASTHSPPDVAQRTERASTPIDLRQREAFDAYVAAKARTDETGSFEDARAAGAAWRRFMDLYLPSDRRLGEPASCTVLSVQHPEARP